VVNLHIEDIVKVIHGKTIVAPFSLSINEGQIVTLCGGNGAGKSSIITMVAGINQPSGGAIKLGEYSLQQHREQYLANIGYMPDDYQFTGSFTAFEMLSFWGELKRQPVSVVRELLELVGLQHTGKKKVQQFSKGMRQRLLLAQALLSKPSLLLLDEPTNGLDPYWMKQFVTIINAVANEGTSVLFSTHQLGVAEAVADHIILLDQGQVKLSASYGKIKQQYGEQGLQRAYEAIFWGDEGAMERVRS